MGRCIEHTRCPQCASRGEDRHKDNLGVYEDGSTFCFKCGYGKGKKPGRSLPVKKDTCDLTYPFDVDTTLSVEALEYLSRYKFTHEEIIKHEILWSERNQRLIFPVKDSEGCLFAWTGRYIPKRGTELDKQPPKWYTKGFIHKYPYILHTINPDIENNVLYVVEDIISGIIVSRYYNVLVLFGSHISKDLMYMISMLRGGAVVVWLDEDKRYDAHKYVYQLNDIGVEARNVTTMLDPKDFMMINTSINKWCGK